MIGEGLVRELLCFVKLEEPGVRVVIGIDFEGFVWWYVFLNCKVLLVIMHCRVSGS